MADSQNQPQNDDISSFAGTYPQSQPPGPSPLVEPVQDQAPNPFVTEPVANAPVPPTPEPQQPSMEAQTYVPPPPVEPFAPPPAVETQAPAPVGIADNPFATPAQSKGNGGTVKRVLAIILLLIALLVFGFLAFTFIGKFLTQNQPKVLTYWGLWENDQVILPIIEEYQKAHPNIQITYAKQSAKQYRERLENAITRDEGPDIFRFHNTWVPMLKEELSPAGTTGYTEAEFEQTFYPVAVEDLVVSGSVYGTPLEFDGLALYYNEDILRAAGVTPPTTWEDFRNAALTMTVKDSSGKIITAGAALGTSGNVEHFSDILGLMMLQNGADPKNPVTSEGQQALAFYTSFAQKPNHVWDETLDNSILAFAGGNVAFVFAPSWQVFTIRDLNPQLKFSIVPVPQLPGTNVNWASYWVEGVSQKSKYKDEAWEFLKFLSSKETLVKLYTEQSKLRAFGEPYSRIDLSQELENDPLVGAYVRQAPTARSFFLSSRTYDNGINDRMIKYLEDAVNVQSQGVAPDAALRTASQGFSQVLSSFEVR